jgi:hypothetical protein
VTINDLPDNAILCLTPGDISEIRAELRGIPGCEDANEYNGYFIVDDADGHMVQCWGICDFGDSGWKRNPVDELL